MKTYCQTLLAVMVAGVLFLGLYYAAYKSAYATLRSPHPEIYVFGIALPGDKAAMRVFDRVFYPLIRLSTSRIPTEEVMGTFDALVPEALVAIKKVDGTTTSMRYVAELEETLNSLRQGDPVQGRLRFQTVKDQPFIRQYELVELHKITPETP